jgi:hypothetical protein
MSDQPRAFTRRTYRCCRGRTIIIEVFERGSQPKKPTEFTAGKNGWFDNRTLWLSLVCM